MRCEIIFLYLLREVNNKSCYTVYSVFEFMFVLVYLDYYYYLNYPGPKREKVDLILKWYFNANESQMLPWHKIGRSVALFQIKKSDRELNHHKACNNLGMTNSTERVIIVLYLGFRGTFIFSKTVLPITLNVVIWMSLVHFVYFINCFFKLCKNY